MRNELNASTAIEDGIVAIPGGGEPTGKPAAFMASVQNNLPPNEQSDDLTGDPQGRLSALKPDATGPPNSGGDAEFWNALINEKTAAEYLGMTDRWMQAKRQHGGGPQFVRISQRCIRYRRIDLKAYSEARIRMSTSDGAQ